jgi:hypothetical protein
MPNIQVQFRRGTTTQHGSFTGAVGEVTVDTDLDTLRVHDGSTAGGVRLAKHSELGGLADGSVTTAKIADDAVTNAKIGPGAVGSTEISANAVGQAAMQNNSVGTAELIDDNVTFAKMQNISTAKVIGRTSAGTGNPEEVSILDEDAMTSDSATALATQQSIKAYVDSQVSAGTVSKWDSGWVSQDDQSTPVSVGGGATMVFDHDLGSAAVGSVFSVYAAEDSSGTNMESQDFVFWQDTSGGYFEWGIQVQSITSTQVTLQLADNSGYEVSSNGEAGTKNWGTGSGQFSHVKVVLVG